MLFLVAITAHGIGRHGRTGVPGRHAPKRRRALGGSLRGRGLRRLRRARGGRAAPGAGLRGAGGEVGSTATRDAMGCHGELRGEAVDDGDINMY